MVIRNFKIVEKTKPLPANEKEKVRARGSQWLNNDSIVQDVNTASSLVNNTLPENSITCNNDDISFDSNFINIVYSNLDSFCLSKKTELLAKLDCIKTSVIAVTEIMPKKGPPLSISKLQLPGYDLFIPDQSIRGVAIYIRNT